MEHVMNLKPLSNETLIDTYVNYHNNCLRYVIARDNATNESDKQYWIDKLDWEEECLIQLKTEILRRMSEHREID